MNTSEWFFKPSEHLSLKVKQRNDSSSEKKPSRGNRTVLNANAGTSTSTFEWQKYSPYEKLLRVAVYILRFLPKNKTYRSVRGAITDPSELEKAQIKIIDIVQSEFFPTEKKNLLKNSPLSSSSKILQFSSFIGPQRLLRATGRTQNSMMLQVLTPNTQFYLIVVIQIHACSSKTYRELIFIRAWTI